MTFRLSVPQIDGALQNIDMASGDILFVLGANGTGKSSLMQRLYSSNNAHSQIISAHRQTWFPSNSITLSPHQKHQTEANMRASDSNDDARWRDDYSSQRANVTIYDLIDAENIRAHGIAAAVDGNNFDLATSLSKEDAPIKTINELLRLSNMPVSISTAGSEKILASKSGGEPYSIAELSDGERNALLIAANVLTAKSGTLLLIDEPERHLHRSIISPLLSLLFKKRSDCAFAISTHEVMLPIDNPSARTLLVRSCKFVGSVAQSWDTDLVPLDLEIDESLKKDILGSRRTLLFVEGDNRSLDKPLYSLLFPKASVIARRSCRDVEQSVVGIRSAEPLHRLRAFGLVDGDGRVQTEIDELEQKGIFCVPAYSVESIYYESNVQRKVVARHSAVTGNSADSLLENAAEAAIAAIKPRKPRLVARIAEKEIRAVLFGKLPTLQQIMTQAPIEISINVATVLAAEQASFDAALANKDVASLIKGYPIRETGALGRIAASLGFQRREQYEGAVRKLLIDDPDTLADVRSSFGKLSAAIDAD